MLQEVEMPDKGKHPSKNEEVHPAETTSKPYVLLALIEHGSRPLALVIIGLFILIFLFKVQAPLFNLLSNTQEVKVGSFFLRLRESARQLNLSKEFTGLEQLSDSQIQLFLIVGDKSKPHITYYGQEVTEENLKKLQDLGLLSEVKRLENGDLFWLVSDKGYRLHQLIMQQVIISMRGR